LGCVSLLEVYVIRSKDLALVSKQQRSQSTFLLTAVGATQLNSTLLTISVIAVLLPAAFHFGVNTSLSAEDEGKDILAVSHGV
jgi:hypothetical protein